MFLGDNIYGDSKNPETLQKKYQKLAAIPGFQEINKTAKVIATWDDHDYGQNDAGTENPIKNESRKIMLDFWGEDQASPRRSQKGGIYTSYYFGSEDQRIQILLLDLRWNRSPIKKVNVLKNAKRKLRSMGPYLPDDSENAIFLGEEQWQWLDKELQKPAKIRILGSSLQLLADFTGWEAWANYPNDLERLYSLVHKHQVSGLLVISGDTHWAEISQKTNVLPYPLYDITSSGLTEEWHSVSPNKNRISKAYSHANYGMIEIKWNEKPIQIHFSIKDQDGKLVMSEKTSLRELSFHPHSISDEN